MSESVALLVHYANLVLVAAVMVFVTLRGSAVASYLAVVIASQFLSPVLWDHYALVLLLPVAWLLARGRWWAAVIPLLTATPLLFLSVAGSVVSPASSVLSPPGPTSALSLPDSGFSLPSSAWVYPIVFWAALLAVAWEGLRDHSAVQGPRDSVAVPA